MTFLAFTEGALAALGSAMAWLQQREGAYAALFCAFRLLCAGVKLSFSSLLLRPRARPLSSKSPPSPESTLPAVAR